MAKKLAASALALGQNDSSAAGSAGYLMLITGSDGQLYMSLINKKWGDNEYLINAVWPGGSFRTWAGGEAGGNQRGWGGEEIGYPQGVFWEAVRSWSLGLCAGRCAVLGICWPAWELRRE